MKFCNHCGETVQDTQKYCNSCGKPLAKKQNMLLYFIAMVIIFVIFDILSGMLYAGGFSVIVLSKYSSEIILEALYCLVVFVVLVMAGNTYIFKGSRSKMSTLKAIGLAIPPILIASLTFIGSIASAIDYSAIDVIGLIFYTFLVGLTEEMMCRGWLLTEFLERYGYDYKHVKWSILCSALVFGCMHITNAFLGQTMLQTINQIIQAIGMGYLLGSVFYRTRNIWSVVFIHAFFDFSLMLPEISKFSYCSGDEIANIYLVIVSVLLSSIYIILGEYNLRKSKTYDLLPEVKELTVEDYNEEKKTNNKLKGLLIIIVVLIFFMYGIIPESNAVCTEYPTKEIYSNYTINEYHYDSYKIYDNLYSYEITVKGDSYYIINEFTKEEQVLTSSKDQILVIQNEKYYVIAIYDDENTVIKYIRSPYSDYLGNREPVSLVFDVPRLKSFNTIKLDSDELYVYFESNEIPNGMIDSDDKLYEISFPNEK